MRLRVRCAFVCRQRRRAAFRVGILRRGKILILSQTPPKMVSNRKYTAGIRYLTRYCFRVSEVYGGKVARRNTGASLECGGLAPLCYRSRPIETKAAPGRRTPRRCSVQTAPPKIELM